MSSMVHGANDDRVLAALLERRHVRVPVSGLGVRSGDARPDVGSYRHDHHDWHVASEVLSGPTTGIECTEIRHIAAQGGDEIGIPANRDCLVFAIDGAGTFVPNYQPDLLRATALRGPCALFISVGIGGVLRVSSREARLLAISDLTRASDIAQLQPSVPLAAIAVSPTSATGYRGTTGIGGDFAVQPLVSRVSGSGRLKAFVATVKPGSGMDFHFHRFDQFYFILSGEMEIGLGEDVFVAPTGSLVVIPAGTIHRNRNAGVDNLMQLTIVSHEPPRGRKPSTAVSIDR